MHVLQKKSFSNVSFSSDSSYDSLMIKGNIKNNNNKKGKIKMSDSSQMNWLRFITSKNFFMITLIKKKFSLPLG